LLLSFSSYLLPDEKNIKSCKTKRVQKSFSPIWDEYFVIDGVAQSQLRKQQLGVRVVNWHLGINKKNSLLGELRIGCSNVFDFHSLASPIITSPSERPVNERVVYSPLVQGDMTRGRNGRPLSDIGTETRGLQSPNNYNQNSRASTTRFDKDSDDDTWTDAGETSGCREGHENSNDISIHVSKFDQDTDNVIVNGTINNSSSKNDNNNITTTNNNRENSLKEPKVKPPRPPPPTRLNLTDVQHSPNESLSPRHYQSNPHTPDPTRKAFTPTFSRLMANLPMSPKRGRRLSWGGESDLSLLSPRSMKSPADHQSMQSDQWDIMISRPKQWIYCWQTLVVSVSE
jgi:hypothetical protein